MITEVLGTDSPPTHWFVIETDAGMARVREVVAQEGVAPIDWFWMATRVSFRLKNAAERVQQRLDSTGEH